MPPPPRAEVIDLQPLRMAGRAEFLRAAPFALYIVLLALRDPVSGWLGSELAPWWYVVQVLPVALLLFAFARHYEELRWQALPAREWLLALGAGLGVFLFWIQLDLPWLSLNAGAPAQSPLPGSSLDPLWLVVRLAGSALMVPVMEELFWRSLVMRWLDGRDFRQVSPQQISLFAMLLSSLVFGLEHSLWFAGLLAGLVYAWLYRRGSLWSAVIAHALTNLALGLWVIATASWQFW